MKRLIILALLAFCGSCLANGSSTVLRRFYSSSGMTVWVIEYRGEDNVCKGRYLLLPYVSVGYERMLLTGYQSIWLPPALSWQETYEIMVDSGFRQEKLNS